MASSRLKAKTVLVHLELLFIHPYREGNGRTAKLVATLMAKFHHHPGNIAHRRHRSTSPFPMRTTLLRHGQIKHR
ncbi:Fic family protein [Chlorobium ferrooxidans]|uniref:Fido domain-containing protein n=1 Tax=Chlorobium ferrooxidans DSM 13031 TaxID=377431 RepID=Q0YTA2_9CHLB|nr:hypothetical protein CferDRAFT_1667 [Chlorobium ferrooxidans DSM 13031]